ncbi:hypothetical protein [Embleya sp. NPDC050493]|uniref:hypothetical protein n=1 Tax=Embleya sp. NPDC050493 TaxID=3363989 RepID=UPI00379C1CFD
MTLTDLHRPPTPPNTTDPTADPAGPVYRERAHLVAELAARWRSVRVDRAPDLPEFALVQAHTPAGSMSWHINRERDEDLLAGIPTVDPDHPSIEFDGHTTAAKYARLRSLHHRLPGAPPVVVGERVVYRDGRGHLWITTTPGRLRSLTPDHAPARHDTPTAVLAATGSLIALGNAR